jgi:hypothetical protein
MRLPAKLYLRYFSKVSNLLLKRLIAAAKGLKTESTRENNNNNK